MFQWSISTMFNIDWFEKSDYVIGSYVSWMIKWLFFRLPKQVTGQDGIRLKYILYLNGLHRVVFSGASWHLRWYWHDMKASQVTSPETGLVK